MNNTCYRKELWQELLAEIAQKLNILRKSVNLICTYCIFLYICSPFSYTKRNINILINNI